MNELDAIFAAAPEAGDAVLATVVHVTGSAYRRPGARMLIFPDGRRIGSVSGGCLEGDVSRKAWWFTEGGAPSVRIYDTSSEDDAVYEFGLGCNGVVHVLFERLSAPETSATIESLRRARSSRQTVVVATVVAVTPGSTLAIGNRMVMFSDGSRTGSLAGSELDADLSAHAHACFSTERSHLAHLDGCDVFIEYIAPAPQLVIFGAGHDVPPLVKIARQIGWHVTVADGRANFARPERFPEADRVVLIHPDNPLAHLDIQTGTLVVVMTHSYAQDLVLLERLLPCHPRYLGLLGPASRARRLLDEIGVPITPVELHAPAGLDLGAETPAAIALSISAEIQAVLAGRDGGMLKHREQPIHLPVEESGVASTELLCATEAALCELS